MQVNIVFFATLKDLTGKNKVTLTLPKDSVTVADVRLALDAHFPQMKENIAAAIASVNREYAFNDDVVNDGDEVAFFPPVSGGATDPDTHPELYLLPDKPINHDEIIAAITTTATGAVCLFSGMVRGKTDKVGHLPETQQLEYEAYEPMALAKMRQVATEIRQQWPKVQGIAIAQRVGVIDVGGNTVLIACSSAHRNDGCFEAARYGIDRLKEIVPVWKKEISPEGQTWVEGEYVPSTEDREAGAD